MTSGDLLERVCQALRARLPGCTVEGEFTDEDNRRKAARAVVTGSAWRPVGEFVMTGPTNAAAVRALAESLGVSIEEGGR